MDLLFAFASQFLECLSSQNWEVSNAAVDISGVCSRTTDAIFIGKRNEADSCRGSLHEDLLIGGGWPGGKNWGENGDWAENGNWSETEFEGKRWVEVGRAIEVKDIIQIEEGDWWEEKNWGYQGYGGKFDAQSVVDVGQLLLQTYCLFMFWWAIFGNICIDMAFTQLAE